MALRNGLIKMIPVQKQPWDVWGKGIPDEGLWQGQEQETCVAKVGGDESQQTEVILTLALELFKGLGYSG